MYMLTFGYHLERLFHQLINERLSANFYITMFHHVITLQLIFISFFLKYTMLGIPIMLLHDFSEIFLNSGRFFAETKYDYATRASVMLLFLSWFYTRIWLFSKEVLYGIVQCFLNYDLDFAKRYKATHLFFLVALFGLLFLNITWFV